MHRKRLIVACDGTWMNADRKWNGSWLPWNQNDKVLRKDPSNITRICRALKNESSDGTPQIIYYQAGVGTEQSFYLYHVIGGLTGLGIADNIMEAYMFIASNWQPGDELVLLGFSRGAFTARSIAGLIESIGVLNMDGMDHFMAIFKDWENQLDPDFVNNWPLEEPNTVRKDLKIQDGSYAKELQACNLTTLNVPIKCVGVWDTVGALGIPDLGLIRFNEDWKEFTLSNTEVCSNVEYAFQALALDEHRKPYSPTLWEKPSKGNNLKVLKQCWMPGVRMMSQLHAYGIVEFVPGYCTRQHELNVRYYGNTTHKILPWSLGRIYDSMTIMFQLAGKLVRTPGRYCRINPKTNTSTSIRLGETSEYFHPSVRIRRELQGHGAGLWHYNPEPLKGWECLSPGAKCPGIDEKDAELSSYRWTSNVNGDIVIIPEEKLGEYELELLKLSPEVYDRFTW